MRRTDYYAVEKDHHVMDPLSTPRIVFAERLSGGVVVTFEDGKSALFSAPLLYATRFQALDITDIPCVDDD